MLDDHVHLSTLAPYQRCHGCHQPCLTLLMQQQITNPRPTPATVVTRSIYATRFFSSSIRSYRGRINLNASQAESSSDQCRSEKSPKSLENRRR